MRLAEGGAQQKSRVAFFDTFLPAPTAVATWLLMRLDLHVAIGVMILLLCGIAALAKVVILPGLGRLKRFFVLLKMAPASTDRKQRPSPGRHLRDGTRLLGEEEFDALRPQLARMTLKERQAVIAMGEGLPDTSPPKSKRQDAAERAAIEIARKYPDQYQPSLLRKDMVQKQSVPGASSLAMALGNTSAPAAARGTSSSPSALVASWSSRKRSMARTPVASVEELRRHIRRLETAEMMEEDPDDADEDYMERNEDEDEDEESEMDVDDDGMDIAHKRRSAAEGQRGRSPVPKKKHRSGKSISRERR